MPANKTTLQHGAWSLCQHGPPTITAQSHHAQIVNGCRQRCETVRGRLAADVLSVRTEQVLRPEELVGAFPTKSTVGLMV